MLGRILLDGNGKCLQFQEARVGEGYRPEQAMRGAVGVGAMGRGKKWMEIILDLVGDIPSLSSALSSWLGQPLAEVVVEYQTQEEP